MENAWPYSDVSQRVFPGGWWHVNSSKHSIGFPTWQVLVGCTDRRKMHRLLFLLTAHVIRTKGSYLSLQCALKSMLGGMYTAAMLPCRLALQPGAMYKRQTSMGATQNSDVCWPRPLLYDGQLQINGTLSKSVVSEASVHLLREMAHLPSAILTISRFPMGIFLTCIRVSHRETRTCDTLPGSSLARNGRLEKEFVGHWYTMNWLCSVLPKELYGRAGYTVKQRLCWCNAAITAYGFSTKSRSLSIIIAFQRHQETTSYPRNICVYISP